MARTIANTKDGIRRLNTKVWDDNGHFAVKLYATVVYDETRETITLNNGGWVTPTTTSRINQALAHRGFTECGVFIKGGEMYFQRGANPAIAFKENKFVMERGA